MACNCKGKGSAAQKATQSQASIERRQQIIRERELAAKEQARQNAAAK